MVSTFIGLLDIQSWWEIPCISHFCSLFSSAFDLPDIDIEDLESALLCDGTDYQVGLVPELIVRLLKGCDALKCVANDITTSNYQMFLRRYLRQQCRIHNIENHFDTDIDFQSLAVRKRLLILHALCHFRLESRDVEVILSNFEADSLRVEPLGYDSKNSGYWYFYGTRLYREDTKQNNKTKVWQVICFTEEDWQNLAGKFRSATNGKERALFNILNENFLPKLPQLFREREKLRRKKLLQTRNSSRIRNLVEVKARQEQERIKAERLERARFEQRMLVEPPRLASTSKSRRRRSQSTSTASGISTYASSVRPTTNSSDFLYQRETFCLTPDDVGAESTSTIAPNQVDQTSQGNPEEIQTSEEHQDSAAPSSAVLKKRKSKKSKSNSSSKKARKARESGDCSSSTTEDKENCRYISDSDSESDNNIMAPTTNIKLPGRQTNNSLSSLPGNIFIPPLGEGKEPEAPTRRASSNSGGKTSTSGKKQKNQPAAATPAPSTSSATVRAGTSSTTSAEPTLKNKKKNSSKSSSEDVTSSSNSGTNKTFYSTTNISQTNPTILINNISFNQNSTNFLSFTETDEVLQIGMHKVLVYVKNHRDAWPFMDPVEEDIAPRYYTIIRRPMDLLKMEDKLDNGAYNKFSEFRNDFKLIVNNCRLYNGQNNEYTEMVNNLQEAFDKATKKYFDHMSDDDDDSANLNYPDSKMNVFREKYFNKENSEGDEENIDAAAALTKKAPTKVEKHSAKKLEKDEETEEDEIEADAIAESATRSNKRKRKDKDKRRKKKSRSKTVEEHVDEENCSSAEEEVKSKKKKEEPSTSTGRKAKKKTEKVVSKQNEDTKRKQRSSAAPPVSKKPSKADDSDDDSESEEEKPSDSKPPVKVQEKNSHSNQKSKKVTTEVAKKRKSRAKRANTNAASRSKASTRNKSQTGRSEQSEVTNAKHEEEVVAKAEEEDEEEEDGSRSRSASPFKVDLHKKYAKSALNDDTKAEEFDEADFKSVSTSSSSSESSSERPPMPEAAKRSTSKQQTKKPEYRKQSSTGSSSDQSPAKNEKSTDNAVDIPLFLDKYDLIKQRRSRNTIEEKVNIQTVAKKEPKKINFVASASSSTSSTVRTRALRESSEKVKAKSKEIVVVEEKEVVKEEKPVEEEKKIIVAIECVKKEDEYEFKESEEPKQSTSKAPKKSTTAAPPAKKCTKEPEKPPAAKKSSVRKPAAVAIPTPVSPPIAIATKVKPSAALGKSTNLDALDLETEQTLKDINRWLEHTPRFPEFSSASNSPSRYNALLDEFDSVSTKLDAADFRRPVPIATPKIDLVPKLAESLDDLVAEAEVPNNKKDLITELIPAIGSSSVSSSCGTPPHSNNSNNSGGSTSVNASSTSSLAMIPPVVQQKPKEPSTTQLISNPPPPPHIKHQMQKEAKRKSLKEKLSAAANPRRKDMMGTIDRLKPGVQLKVKEIKNALVVKTDDSVPKLSLGSVLDNDGFGLGHSHNFVDREKPDAVVEKREEISKPKVEKLVEHETENATPSVVETPFEVKKVNNPEPKGDSSSATPNLSAWLKAFGVPKKAKKAEEEETKQQQPKPQGGSSETTTAAEKPPEAATNTLNVLKSPTSSDNNNFSQPPPRQRKASTGSTISERSSFSQDPDSPRIAIDERFGSYSGNYTSPIGASPIGASPIMVSPKPEDVGKPNSPYPLNGTIKVGFYQDTTTKSSPEKSCSPRELPSPYPQYSQHIYSSASSPNVSTTEMSGNSPYGGNSYAPSAGSEASKTPVYSSTSPIPNLYEQYKQPQSQESDYNSSMSPSTPNPHSPYQAGANSPYQHPAQSPYQNPNSPYQQQTTAAPQAQQQPSAAQQSLPFQATGIESPSATQNSVPNQVDSTPPTEVQQQNSPYQQPANSPYQQQQPSPYTPSSVGAAYQPPNVFQENTASVAQQPTEAIASAPQPTQQATPQNERPTYDTTQQYHGYQQQTSCQQQQQQQQQPQQDTAMRSMYNLNKSSDWNMPQVAEQFHPPTYSQYTLAAMSKDLSTPKSQDQYLQQQQQQQQQQITNSNPLKRHLDGENDVLTPDYNTKVPKRSDPQQQQQPSKQQQMYDSFLGSIGYGKHLEIPPNKAFEMYNRAANMGFSKEYSNPSTVKDPSTQAHQQPVVDNSIMNKPLNMANSNNYTQQQMQQQVQQQQQQQQNIYNKPQNSYPTNLSQASGSSALDKPNDSLMSHLNTYKPQTYGSPTTSLLNINHHPLSSVIDDSMLGLNHNTAGVPSNGMGGVGYYDKSMPPAAHMNISSQMYQNLAPYGSHSTAISREQQQQSGNYVPSVSNANNVNVPPSSQTMEVMSLESKPPKKTRTRKKANTPAATAAAANDIATKNNTSASQPQMSSTGIPNSQVSTSNAQQQMNLHHSQMQNIQGFQLYSELKTGVSSSSSMPSSTTLSDAGAISLKTTAAAASMVPGSAFNFGTSPAGLGLSAAGIYGDNTGYLDQFRDASNPYYMPAPTHRSGTADSGVVDKSNNAAATSYPFLAHPSSRTPTFNPFVNTPQLDANSPFYQQYLQRQEDFRARMMHQGLLAPGGPAGYPQPGGYRASSLGMPKPYDINRQPWF